jgi:hypothetical protein
MLTPNTRSEAEAALSANSAFQTDAAAPTTPLVPAPVFKPASAATEASSTGVESPELQQQQLPAADEGGRRGSLGQRPPVPTRSSSNYLNALGASGSVDPAEALVEEDAATAASANAPSATKEVADRTVGASSAEDDAVGEAETSPTGWRPRTDRKQSWSHQDMRRMMQEKLMGTAPAEGDMGYDSATDTSRQ